MSTKSRSVTILGAAGAMGGLFARRMAESGWSVTGLDLRAPADTRVFARYLLGDAGAPDTDARDALARSEQVMICLPAEEAVRAIEALPSSIELVVDTLSVKTPLFDRLAAMDPPWEHLSLNPMFAPSAAAAGQPVAAVRTRRGPRGSALIREMEEWGWRVVELPAERHDRLCAVMQAATHGALLALGGVCAQRFEIGDLAAMAPPPHLICLALSARIATASPETYWDIQRHNPHAGELRRQLIAALVQLDEAVERGDREGFTRSLSDLRRSYGADLERLATLAAGAIRVTSMHRRGYRRSPSRLPRRRSTAQ